MQYQVFLRIDAHAKVGWTNTLNNNYEQFRKVLLPLLEVWQVKGIHFAPLTDAEWADNQ